METKFITQDDINVLENSSIVKRTLTFKSEIWFGNYKGRTVQQIIDLKNTGYLRWIYFNLTKIDFIPDILIKLGVAREYKIDKPGKNPELYELFNKKLEKVIAANIFTNADNKGLTGRGKFSYYAKKLGALKKRGSEFRRDQHESKINKINLKNRKSVLQSKNHGKTI